MNDAGTWFKYYRKSTENALYFSERFTKWQAWVDLLTLATYKARTVFIRGVEINLKPGELCWAIESLARRWRWNWRTVDKFLSMLSRRGMIQSRKSNITTVITIRNWTRHQESAEQSTEQSTKQSADKQRRIRRKEESGDQPPKEPKGTPLIDAEEIYRHYATKVRAGAKADAVKSISKLLKDLRAEDLMRCVDRYAGNGMPADTQFRIQANNFFGMKARYLDYLGDTPLLGLTELQTFIRRQSEQTN